MPFLSHDFFKYFFQLCALSLLWFSDDMNVRPFVLVPQVCEALFSFLQFFSLLFRLVNFCCFQVHFLFSLSSLFYLFGPAREGFILVILFFHFLCFHLVFPCFFSFPASIFYVNLFSPLDCCSNTFKIVSLKFLSHNYIISFI